jgi:transposase
MRTFTPAVQASSIYGFDVAKHVFQMFWVNEENGEIVNQRFRGAELTLFLTQRSVG